MLVLLKACDYKLADTKCATKKANLCRRPVDKSISDKMLESMNQPFVVINLKRARSWRYADNCCQDMTAMAKALDI